MIETAEEGYEISDYDIISLYPSCNSKGPYPVGHPKIDPPKDTKIKWQKSDDITEKGLVKVPIFTKVINYRSCRFESFHQRISMYL